MQPILRNLLFLAGILVLLILVGYRQPPDIPAQGYAKMQARGSVGDIQLTGVINYPSNYMQRSTTFLLDDQSFVTHPDGRFRIEGVAKGAHELEITIQGFETFRHRFVLTDGKPVKLAPILLQMARGRIQGRLETPTGQALSRMEIRLEQTRALVRTDKYGIFSLVGVPAGDHFLVLASDARFSQKYAFKLKKGEHKNLGNITVSPKMTPVRALPPLARFRISEPRDPNN